MTRPVDLLTLDELIALRHTAKGMDVLPQRVYSSWSGDQRSPFKGRGMEFSETRAYQAGDEIRHMEWRVMARTGKPHVKLFREERERAVLLWSDCRRPMFHATRGRLKVAQAARAATLAAWSAVQKGNRLGGLLFAEQNHRELRPTLGDRAVLEWIRSLLQFTTDHAAKPIPQSTLQQPLMRLRRVALPGSAIFLFSDFRGLEPEDHAHLAQLARHNDVTLFFIHDPLEQELPPSGGRYPVALPNTMRPALLHVDDPKVRQSHAARFVARQEGLRTLCRTIGARFLSCSTAEDAPTLLLRHLNGHVS
ncbi:MAG: DUF58 domain-containing protein [Magnetococcales bacterium]|nr:DUF58 domain-containing protein [Magnetococcales bacterium]NGZ06916.1 DUF58 domain-containing protein [Magnetococcales bacterium]